MTWTVHLNDGLPSPLRLLLSFSFLIFVLKTLYEKETGNEERYESSPVLPVISVVQDNSNSIFCDYDFF